MPTRYLIAPDKFKGSLTAPQAAHAIAQGIRQIDPTAELDLCPIADGGEGFMETLTTVLHGQWIHCPAVDARGRPILSRYGLAHPEGRPTAIMEMSETAGLWRLSPHERQPTTATTYGVGMQIAHATATHQVTRIILGIGGSATNDGGCGMAAALGLTFKDGNQAPITPLPTVFHTIKQIDFSNRLPLPEILAACDVENPLLGPNGSTAIFSTQKGATPEDQILLENSLSHIVRISAGQSAATTPGAGAAGGLGFGLLHFAGAQLIPGFDLLASLLQLESRIRSSDHIITGEGSIDHQSLSGKGPIALARMALALGKPITAFCGQTDEAARHSRLFHRIHTLAALDMPLETLIAQAAPLLTRIVAASGIARHSP